MMLLQCEHRDATEYFITYLQSLQPKFMQLLQKLKDTKKTRLIIRIINYV